MTHNLTAGILRAGAREGETAPGRQKGGETHLSAQLLDATRMILAQLGQGCFILPDHFLMLLLIHHPP